MANSYVEIMVSGASSYTFPFPYIAETDVKVYVNGVLQTISTHYTFTSSNILEFTAGNVPTDTSHVLLIQRETEAASKLVTYSNTGLDADDLNLGSNQNFYLAQEATDTAERAVSTGADGTLTVGGRLTNVSDPIDNLDATNKQWVASQVAAGSGSVTVDATAPSSPSQGDLWIDTGSNVMYVWTGTQWVNGGVQESVRYDFLGSDGFPISTRSLFGGSLYGSNLAAVAEVYLNGVLLKPTTSILDFTTGDYDILDSTGLSISPAPSASDEITVITAASMSAALVSDIGTIKSNLTDINTVSTNIAGVSSVAANMTDVNNAASNAAAAFSSADLSIIAKVASQNAKDASVIAQGLAEDAQTAAELAETNIVTGLAGKAGLSGATFTGDIDLANDKRIRFKKLDNSYGLQMYTATDGTVWMTGEAGVNFNIAGGNLRVRADDLTLRNRDGSNNYFKGVDSGAVQVYHGDGTERINTTATGIDVTGTVTTEGLNVVTPDGTGATIDVGTDYLTVKCSDLESGLLVKSDSTASGTTPDLYLRRTANATSGTENLGTILFQGLNNASPRENTTYASILCRQANTTDGGEDGKVLHRLVKDGTLTTILAVEKTGIDVNGTVTAGGASFTGQVDVSSGVLTKTTVEPSSTSSVDMNTISSSIPSGTNYVITGGSSTGGLTTNDSGLSVGYTLVIINQSANDQVIDQGAGDTLTHCGQSGVSTGSITLGSGGVATLLLTAANSWTILGSNIT